MSKIPDLRQLGLSPSHIFLMHRLDDGTEEDSVGLEMDEATGRELQVATVSPTRN